MRSIILGLGLLGTVIVGAAAHAASLPGERAMVYPVYWNGDYCGPRCQQHQSRRHERWAMRRQVWRHRRWEERHSGSYYPR
jgi:hypothetical protein